MLYLSWGSFPGVGILPSAQNGFIILLCELATCTKTVYWYMQVEVLVLRYYR